MYPGPTVMVLSTVNKKVGESKQQRQNKKQQLKVDGMTDEFLHLVKTGDAMDMLSAVVHGDMGDDYRVKDDNVNKPSSSSSSAAAAAARQKPSSGAAAAAAAVAAAHQDKKTKKSSAANKVNKNNNSSGGSRKRKVSMGTTAIASSLKKNKTKAKK